jgi:uncharacterized protein YbjT (DUF2867 family)
LVFFPLFKKNGKETKMTKFTLAIMGATGHIGHTLTEDLLKKGHIVRAMGRDERRLKELKTKGAHIFTGDSTDPTLLSHIFTDCDAVFSFLPPGASESDMLVFRERTGEAIAHAIAQAGVSHVVNLSSIGANQSIGTGPIKELHAQEQRLNALEGLNVLHFRPGFFMENLLFFIPSIKTSGTIAGALSADLQIPMVATQDIAHKIASFLDTLTFTKSSVFEFAGPSEITMKDAAKAIGKAIGKPDLKYKHVSYEQAQKNMIAGGLKHHIAHLMIEMYRAFNEGKIVPSQRLTAEHRGKTTLEQFSKFFVHMYQSTQRAA